MNFFIRIFWKVVRLFYSPQATDFTLYDIGEDKEAAMDVTLSEDNPQALKRIVPNKGDTDVLVVSKTLNGSETGDANVSLGPYVSEPGNPLAFTLTRLNPTPTPATLEIVIAPDTTNPSNTITKSYSVEALPDNADDFVLEDIT